MWSLHVLESEGITTDACYITDKLQKYDAKWKKPDTRDTMLYNSVYMESPERKIYRDIK